MMSVKPPRSVFVDFPLGHPCGRSGDLALQRAIVGDALTHLTGAADPGELKDLPYEWDVPFEWSDYMKDVEEMIKEEGAAAQVWKLD